MLSTSVVGDIHCSCAALLFMTDAALVAWITDDRTEMRVWDSFSCFCRSKLNRTTCGTGWTAAVSTRGEAGLRHCWATRSVLGCGENYKYAY